MATLNCETHGVLTWQGHVICAACGQTYKQSAITMERCRCGELLVPPIAREGGLHFSDEDAAVLLGNSDRAVPWKARAICFVCFRRVAKHYNGKLPRAMMPS